MGLDHARNAVRMLHGPAPLQVWDLALQPAMVIRNQLPVPLQAALQPMQGMVRELRHPVGARGKAGVVMQDPDSLQCILIRPRGLTWSSSMEVYRRGPPAARSVMGTPPAWGRTGTSLSLSLGGAEDEEDEEDEGYGGSRGASSDSSSSGDEEDSGADTSDHDMHGPTVRGPPRMRTRSFCMSDHTFLVSAPGAGAASIALRLRAMRVRGSGQLVVTITSPLWVYNCTGLPVALRVEPGAAMRRFAAAIAHSPTQHQPAAAVYGVSAAVNAAYDGNVGRPGGRRSSRPGAPWSNAPTEVAPAATSEFWVPPCIGPDGELLPVGAPRTTHSAAVQAAAQAAAQAAEKVQQQQQAAQQRDQQGNRSSGGQRHSIQRSQASYPGTAGPGLLGTLPRASPSAHFALNQQPGSEGPPFNSPPGKGLHRHGSTCSLSSAAAPGLPTIPQGSSDMQLSGGRGLGLFLTPPPSTSTPTLHHGAGNPFAGPVSGDNLARQSSASLLFSLGSANVAEASAPAAVSTSPRMQGTMDTMLPMHPPAPQSAVTWGSRGYASTSGAGRANSVAPSRSSARSLGSRGSHAHGAGQGSLLWQPAMLPVMCGDVAAADCPLQLRIVPQGGLGVGGGGDEESGGGSFSSGVGSRGGSWAASSTQWWSKAVSLGQTAGPVVLALPCPTPKEDAASGGVRELGAGAYFVCVRLVRVRGAKGCWALHVLPRFVLHNALPLPLQLQQHGAGRLRTLAEVDDKWKPLDPGQSRPVHWPDALAPLRLALRVYEPGWSWSGSVDVGKGEPGDVFVKVSVRSCMSHHMASGVHVLSLQLALHSCSTTTLTYIISEQHHNRHHECHCVEESFALALCGRVMMCCRNK